MKMWLDGDKGMDMMRVMENHSIFISRLMLVMMMVVFVITTTCVTAAIVEMTMLIMMMRKRRMSEFYGDCGPDVDFHCPDASDDDFCIIAESCCGMYIPDLKQAAKEQASRDFPWEEEPDPSSPPAARASGGRALRRQNAMDRKNTSIATDLQKVLLPQQQKLGRERCPRFLDLGYLCAQFDLDLFLLSGGIFPGLLGIGLLGDIHYQPATKCFGWTAELYLMLSIGFSVFGMDFRVAVVVIATLVVTERPLAAGSKDLVWAEWNPFSLISSTSREGWGFIYTHILSNQYLQHAEVEVQRYLDKNKDDINNFKRYLDLIEPPRALPTKVVSASQSQGLAKEGIMGSVQVTGRWGKDGLKLEVTLPKDLRVKSDSVSANIMQFTRFVRATIWQDLGDALLSQRSDDCLSPPKHGYHCFPA
eukprot:s1550_g2.t1